MYEDTLAYYGKTIGKKYPMVFVENSGVSIEHWKDRFGEKLNLEIIQFNPDDPVASAGFDNSKGKGYNEYLMIKKALQTSERLRECSHFLKITGRYAMLNIKKMIKEIERRAEDKVFFDDVKDNVLLDVIGKGNRYGIHWGDSRYFVASIDYYKKNLMDIYMRMNDYNGNDAESVLFGLYKRHKDDAQWLFRYKTQVQFGGVSGYISPDFHEEYNSPRVRAKNMVRQLVRWLLPCLKV